MTFKDRIRQAADDAVINNCNLGDVPRVIREEVADAVARETLQAVIEKLESAHKEGWFGEDVEADCLAAISIHNWLLAEFTPQSEQEKK